MELGYLFTTIVKMVALVAWIYGLLWGLEPQSALAEGR